MQWIQRFWFESPRWRVVLAAFVLTCLHSGIWQIPNMALSRLIAQSPLTNPFGAEPAGYLMWSWLGPALAWLLGATSPAAFFVLHLLCSVAFWGLTVGTMFSRLPEQHARTALVLFMLLPVSGTSLFWVGYDSVTLLLMALVLVCVHRPWLVALPASALGMQHFEQGVVGAVLLAVSLGTARAMREPGQAPMIPGRSVVLIVVGLVAGRATLMFLFAQSGVHVAGRGDWFTTHAYKLLANFVLHAPVTLWAALGAAWAVVGLNLAMGRAASWPVLAGLVAGMPWLVVVDDSTRVFAIVSFWLLAVHWLLNARLLERIDTRMCTLLLIAAVVTPWIWVWSGLPQTSVLAHDLALLSNWLTGWPALPGNLSTWPFTCSWCR